MSNSPTNVLIFGPSGQVARFAALESSTRGAKVWLAMRDTSKKIDGLSDDAKFSRVQADLLNPDSIKDAVAKSGAKIAFVYVIWQSKDYMRTSFKALKEAGITYAVLLSSYGVQGSPREEINHRHFVAKVHAETEIALDESGISYTTVRPAFFSSNIFGHLEGIKKGEVGLFSPTSKFDWITTEDIGAVCGALLTQESENPPKEVYLCGQQVISHKEALQIIAGSVGREIQIKELTETAWREKDATQPPELMDSLKGLFEANLPPRTMYEGEIYENAKANVLKYSGREPMTFEGWVDRNKEAFV
ncbi:hypothetical protein B0J11DRAFT_501020 [Dendryphion nanum]|uniref:NmrA-like domain-containing protein n=1 Tax=Dendryphion nanum TaxID=256645 RepID=A0A9P9EIF5_9PLEO|nr:hypothetical protein B0J11DRAFT_501020 [Dendryphion nanum]